MPHGTHTNALIHQACLEMKRRYVAGDAGAPTENYVPILLVLDEFGALLKDITDSEAVEQPTDEEISSLLRLGRTARIHAAHTGGEGLR